MAPSSTKPVLIAGGGIGGLAAALGLAQKGIRSILLEKASALGAGIQLGPNAFHAFDYLGVGEAARSMAVYIDQLRLMDALTAEEITHVDLRDAFRSRFGNPYGVVHRGDLHGVFLKACRDHELIELRVSSEVTGYDQDGSSVTAHLASGDDVAGRLLIGADGLWSNIRKQVTADGPPRVSGHTTYRSVIPTEEMPEDLRWNAATLWAGPKCHIVHYPLSGWKVFNLVATYHNDAPEPVAGCASPRAEHHPSRQELEAVGVVRPRSQRALGRRPRRAARRRRASDAAIFRARRLPGDGGRGVPVAHAGQPSRRSRGRAGALPAAFSPHRAGAADVPRHRRAHLSPRRRTRPPPQRHHAGEEFGGLLPRSGVALWRDGAGRIV
jgi:2-polyprenyl-6-methoxyphenol hydroxylase-like FAD-dependent oxidoreductase